MLDHALMELHFFSPPAETSYRTKYQVPCHKNYPICYILWSTCFASLILGTSSLFYALPTCPVRWKKIFSSRGSILSFSSPFLFTARVKKKVTKEEKEKREMESDHSSDADDWALIFLIETDEHPTLSKCATISSFFFEAHTALFLSSSSHFFSPETLFFLLFLLCCCVWTSNNK